ncbi:MAG TPA: hypothetical protein VEK39_03385 [Solirubrobacterales bacterium]|nr:hypothetical protein [Solirubrobacterales bacterium]
MPVRRGSEPALVRAAATAAIAAIAIAGSAAASASQSPPASNDAAKAKPRKHHVSGQVFADNDFELYVNGKLVAEDPIDFTPFNVVPVEFRASYPMTFAIWAKDFADPTTGLEYDNTQTGDGGLIAAFSNGVVTNGSWRSFVTFRGPTNVAECLADPATCHVETSPEPKDWNQPGFKAKGWAHATEHSRDEVQPHAPDFDSYDWDGAEFVWGPDLVQDNTVLVRKVFKRAP